MSVVGSVQVTPTNPRPGQSVIVEALDPEDAPLPDASIHMNGRLGAVQHLQFAREGDHKVAVRLTEESGVQESEVTITVAGSPMTFHGSHESTPKIAMLHMQQSQLSPYAATFSLGGHSRETSDQQETSTARRRTSAPIGHVSKKPVQAGSALGRVMEERGKTVFSRRQPLVASRRAGRRLVVDSHVVSMGGVDIAKVLERERSGVSRREFRWEFGDGTTAVTSSPTVDHDYFTALGPDEDQGIFTVSCTAVADGVTVSRTLVLHSAYALCKKQGAIVPHLKGDVYAKKISQGLSGNLVVHNIEAFPLVLDHQAIVPWEVDPEGDDLAIPSFTDMDTPITIAANSSSVIAVNVAYSPQFPENLPAFTVYYGGSGDGTKVRLSHTFELSAADQHASPARRERPEDRQKPVFHAPWEEVAQQFENLFGHPQGLGQHSTIIDRGTGTVAINLGRGSAGADAVSERASVDIVMGSLATPAYQDRVVDSSTRMIPGLTEQVSRARILPEMHVMSGTVPPPPRPGPVREGQFCDPGNLTEEVHSEAEERDLVCQLTNEGPREYAMPARFMNARKGDIILSPGGGGAIARLLQQVTPPQIYSHTGIMTRNYDEITHSTAKESWLTDQKTDHIFEELEGGDGIRPEAMKYLWPGVVRQSVDAAVHGEDFVSPQGKTYSIGSFSPHAIGATHNDVFEIVPPLVVKPDPFQETPPVRSSLHAAAIEARTGAGTPDETTKSHYRFFGYTDPVSVLTPSESGAGWANGTYGTVCSSFVWDSHKKLGHHLESDTSNVMTEDLEESDTAQGAQARPGNNPDGLYLYTAAERRAAAQWLYDYVYYIAMDEAGPVVDFFNDAADDNANQFVNTFVSDDAEGKDSDDWKQTRDAVAVSPSDILFWDPPSKGGLYGFAEPLQYREPRVESYTPSRWKKVFTRGNVQGKVTYQGQPVGGASVEVYDGKNTFTASDGSYTLEGVGFGNYTLKAQKLMQVGSVSMLTTAASMLRVNEPEVTANLELQDPPERYRMVKLFVDFYGVDDEYWPASDEIKDPGPEQYELELGPDRTVNSKHLTYKWGGELRVEYKITCRLLADNDVEVEVQSWLYEGTSESSTEIDGTRSTTFRVGRGSTEGLTLKTENDNEGGDWAELAITAKNTRNTN